MAPVAPISIALRPLGQLPLLEIYKAFVLLSTQAFTTGVVKGFAIAKPPTTVAPKMNPVKILKAVLFI